MTPLVITNTSEKVRFDSVDIMKFILSIIVAAIHIRPLDSFSPLFRPLLRCAVPLFFIASAYFFFKKRASLATDGEKLAHMERYAKRNLQLYLFWLVVLLIPTIHYRKYFQDGILAGILTMLKDFAFSSTFIASWYIVASVIGVAIIATLSRHMGNGAIAALLAPIYAVCCLMSNYGNTSFVQAHAEALHIVFSAPYNSFWIALPWMLAGKIIADNGEVALSIKRGTLVAFLALGLACLAVEQAIVVSNGFAKTDDCFFSLPLVCAPAFLLVLGTKASCPFTSFLRSASTVTYCLHATLRYLMLCACSITDVAYNADAAFLVILAFCWLLAWIILKAERLPHFALLRYSH